MIHLSMLYIALLHSIGWQDKYRKEKEGKLLCPIWSQSSDIFM